MRTVSMESKTTLWLCSPWARFSDMLDTMALVSLAKSATEATYFTSTESLRDGSDWGE